MRSIFLFIFLLLFLPIELSARFPTEVEGDLPRNYWQFIFLLESTNSPGQEEFHIHPLYGQYENFEKAYDHSYILYPVFFSHGTNYWRRWSLLYLLSGDDFYHVDTGSDSDILIPPFTTIGSGDNEKESYFGVFPLYGTIKDFFGEDELSYVLFPLYTSWTYKDYTAYSFIWPLTLYGNNEKKSEFRILFLYSSKERKNKYKRTSLLWPLLQWGSLGLDKKEPRHYFTSFPLFGYKWSDNDNLFAWTFLWLPFFGGLASYGRDNVKEEESYTFLFSLFQYHKSKDPGIEKLVLFPFYGHYRFGELDGGERSPFYKEATFITPLYAHLETYSSIFDSDYHFFIPFYLDLKRYYHKEREEESYIKFWPFFKYVESNNGRIEFSSLALWPLRSDQFDKVWGPLYSIVEYRQHENGDQYISFLLRLYSQYWNESESHYFLAGLEWHNEERHWSFEILGGLLGIHRYETREKKADWAFEFLWFDISKPDDVDEL